MFCGGLDFCHQPDTSRVPKSWLPEGLLAGFPVRIDIRAQHTDHRTPYRGRSWQATSVQFYHHAGARLIPPLKGVGFRRDDFCNSKKTTVYEKRLR
jgi:hypothetical protein